jgi:hypothetical protein
MGLLSEFLGGASVKEITLSGVSEGRRRTLKVDKSGRISVRVSKDELENLYITDSITFNSINKTVQLLMSSDYYLDSKQKRVVTFFDKFFKEIGIVGERLTQLELLEWLYRDACIFGEGYVEIIYDDKTQSKPLDLTRVDPKKVDVARDSTGFAVVDAFGRSVGFTMKIPYGVTLTAKGDPVPKEYEGVVDMSQKIFLLPKRLVQFKLYPYGDGFTGIGLIESAFSSIKRKMAITEAQTNSIYTRGTYPIIANVGDENHEPGQKEIDNTLNIMRDMKHDRYFAFPYWTQIKPLEVKQSDIVDNTLKFLREDQSASLGMPMAFATGTGEATNRATLNNQQQIMQLTLNDIQKRVLSVWNKFIMNLIAKAYDLPETCELKATEIGAEEKNEKTTRLTQYVGSGILDPKLITSYAIKSEGLENQENSKQILT